MDAHQNVKKMSIVETLKFLLSNITLWCLSITCGCAFFMINAAQLWAPTFFRRVHGLSPSDLSKYLTWISPIGGTLGTIAGGLVGGYLPKLNKRWYSVVIFSSLFIILFLQAAIYLVPNYIVSLTLTFFASFVS